MSQQQESKLVLELGQVIQIISPLNANLHEKIFLIEYLDDNLIKLVNEETTTEIRIIDGKFTDESIETIHILANPKEKGYARQNELVVNKWISIQFGGKIPTIINGKITDLEEDQIQITTYPDNKIIYIDFEYKGIPTQLPIISINEIESPILKTAETDERESLSKTKVDSEELEDAEFLDEDEDLELILDTEIIKENIKNVLIDVDDIILDAEEDLGFISEEIQVSEDQKRYGIDNQTNDLLDELLSSYPSNERTKKVINKIHISIERFKQLRIMFSNFDEYGNAESILKKGAQYKPLIKKLEKLNYKLYWLMPIVKNKHKIYDTSLEDDVLSDVLQTTLAVSREAESEIYEQYKRNTIPDGQNKYLYLFERMNEYFTPFTETDDLENVVAMKKVEENLDVVIDNLYIFQDYMTYYITNLVK